MFRADSERNIAWSGSEPANGETGVGEEEVSSLMGVASRGKGISMGGSGSFC